MWFKSSRHKSNSSSSSKSNDSKNYDVNHNHTDKVGGDGLVVEVLDYNAGTKLNHHDHDQDGIIKTCSTQDTTMMMEQDTYDDHDVVEIDLESYRHVVPEKTPQQQEKEQAQKTTTTTRRRRRRFVCFVSFCFLIIMIVVLAIVFGLRFSKGNQSSTDAPPEDASVLLQGTTPMPTLAPSSILNLESANYLVTILRPYTPVWILFDDTMPQGKAFSALLHLEVAATSTSTGTSTSTTTSSNNKNNNNTRNNSNNTPPSKVLQRYSLLVLYYETGGNSSWFQKWNVLESNECTWFGVESCRSIDVEGDTTNTNSNTNSSTSTSTTSTTTSTTTSLMAVGQLNIVSNNMRGTIPSELCLLGPHLFGLTLSNNLLTGTLPPCMVQFVNLTVLDLRNNLLRGALPPLGYSPFLQSIDLSSNRFAGTIDDIFQPTNQLSVLQELYLQDNDFTGTVPWVLSPSQNPSLINISLSNNPMTGQVPFCFSGLSVDCQTVDCPCCSNCAAT